MNDGFKKMTVSDPNKLISFLEGTTGSILAILNVFNTLMLKIMCNKCLFTELE